MHNLSAPLLLSLRCLICKAWNRPCTSYAWACVCVRACLARHACVHHTHGSFTLRWQRSLRFNPPHVLLSQRNIIRRLLLLLQPRRKPLDSGLITGHSNLERPSVLLRATGLVWQLPIIHCSVLYSDYGYMACNSWIHLHKDTMCHRSCTTVFVTKM